MFCALPSSHAIYTWYNISNRYPRFSDHRHEWVYVTMQKLPCNYFTNVRMFCALPLMQDIPGIIYPTVIHAFEITVTNASFHHHLLQPWKPRKARRSPGRASHRLRLALSWRELTMYQLGRPTLVASSETWPQDLRGHTRWSYCGAYSGGGGEKGCGHYTHKSKFLGLLHEAWSLGLCISFVTAKQQLSPLNLPLTKV